MKNTMKTLLLLAFATCFSNCGDEVVILFDSLEARLVAFDEASNERALFAKETNIRFALMLVNSSPMDVEAGTYYDYCSIYEVDEFLLIYKSVTYDNGEASWVPVSKPYVPPISCPTIPVPVVVPANGETPVCGMA